MIEGGTPGGSALAQATQRRATAEKLLTEAAWLEGVAADERAMAAQLAVLPPSYSVIHDLRVPGSKGNIDHVVIGPGGAFVVMTRRFDGQLSYHDGQLWAGDASLRGDFESARVEAQLLTQSLGTAVVPVIGYLGAGLPQGAPSALDGVLVCAADTLVKVVSRGSHTNLTPDKVLEAARKAVPFQNSPGSVTRGLGQVPPPPAPLQRPVAGAPGTPAVSTTPDLPRRRSGRTEHEHLAWKRSVMFVAAIIASLCLVAFAAGTLLRVLWADKPASSGAPTGTLDPSSTTIFITPGTGDPTATADGSAVPTSVAVAAIPSPIVRILPTCPTPGQGWSLVPTWPGDVTGLAHYTLELQQADGTWSVVGTMANANSALGAAVAGQQSNVTITLRMTAVLTDGSQSPATVTKVITPAISC
jgi:hypothetical protein